MVFPRDMIINDYNKGFFLYNGGRLGSLSELLNTLENIQEYQFSYHVNEEKNDFANWIRDVFGDIFLARRVAKAKSKKELKKILFCYIYK